LQQQQQQQRQQCWHEEKLIIVQVQEDMLETIEKLNLLRLLLHKYSEALDYI